MESYEEKSQSCHKSQNIKYTVWVDYGLGWVPTEYENIQDCLEHESYGHKKRITKDIRLEVIESNK